jgi:hypothetical protein
MVSLEQRVGFIGREYETIGCRGWPADCVALCDLPRVSLANAVGDSEFSTPHEAVEAGEEHRQK